MRYAKVLYSKVQINCFSKTCPAINSIKGKMSVLVVVKEYSNASRVVLKVKFSTMRSSLCSVKNFMITDEYESVSSLKFDAIGLIALAMNCIVLSCSEWLSYWNCCRYLLRMFWVKTRKCGETILLFVFVWLRTNNITFLRSEYGNNYLPWGYWWFRLI